MEVSKSNRRQYLDEPLYVEYERAIKQVYNMKESVETFKRRLKNARKRLHHWEEKRDVLKIEWRTRREELKRCNHG